MNMEMVRQEISHGCDGPLTFFVLMMRAMALVEQGKAQAEPAAEALAAELEERGMLRDGLVEVTGS